jgi:hypothetical protein
MSAMLPANLSETLNNLGDAARALTEEVRADRVRQRRRSVIDTTLLVLVAVLVLALFMIVLQNRARSDENAAILRQTALTGERIADCTTVGGKCYEQGGQRAASAVQMVIRAEIYKDSCSKVEVTDAAIEQCVLRRLLENPVLPTPTPGPAATGRASPQPSASHAG